MEDINNVTLSAEAIDVDAIEIKPVDYKELTKQDLIRMLFGIGMDPVDSKDVSDMFGVGKERIRQMKETALGRLKKKFSNQLKGLLQ